MTSALCRFPTVGGPCGRAVASAGDHCDEHAGLDVVAAAKDVARTLRAQQAKEQVGLRARRRADALAQGAGAETAMSDEQIAGVAECLNRHQVEYVLVGGGAAQLHGAPITRTRDADVVPSKAGDNLDRLAAALREMNARVWAGPHEPDGLPMAFDRGTLGQIDGFLNLVTQFGPLDVTYRPDGTGGYADLAQSVAVVKLLGVDVPVASLEDIIRSKEAAGRPKDIAALPLLIEYSRRSRSEP